MERLFDVAVTKSLDLVTEQIRLIRKRKATSVDLIILCGGLGSSPYVKKRFEDFCQDDLGGKVTVVQPLEPWSAVCRGAALRGLEKYPVVSRRSRAYYGFAAHEEFNTEKHDEADAFWDLEFGKRAKDQMFWPIKRHEKLKHNTVKIRKCRYTVPPNVIEFTGEECLYQCDNDSQPLKLNDESGELQSLTKESPH